MKYALLLLGLGMALGAGLALADEPSTSIPFRLGKKRALLVPVQVGDSLKSEFLLHTGLGFEVVSPELAKKLGMEASPNHKVHPVTGGELDLSRGKLSALAVGNRKETDLEVVVAEPRRFVGNDGETGVEGILSLAFFREHPFTVDYANQTLVLEDSESLSRRKAAGTKVECRLSDENVVALVSLALKDKDPDPPSPTGLAGILSGITGGGGSPEPPSAWVQVDTACDSLLLDSKLMFTLKVDATGSNITETEATDQNGVRTRRFASRMGKVGLGEGAAVSQLKQPVVFRKLQAEGVLGQSFLSNYVVTFDLPGSELIFAKAPGK